MSTAGKAFEWVLADNFVGHTVVIGPIGEGMSYNLLMNLNAVALGNAHTPPTHRFLITVWGVDTEEGHEVEIIHRDIPVADDDEAGQAQGLVNGVALATDGTLTYLRGDRDDVTVTVPEADVTISVYTRPLDQRGRPFVPDTTTEAGRAQIAATMIDPAYIVQPDEMKLVTMSLRELAALPGAAGRLQSLAYS
jgi:hypothetical protein